VPGLSGSLWIQIASSARDDVTNLQETEMTHAALCRVTSVSSKAKTQGSVGSDHIGSAEAALSRK
jgi:hypothetical protein